MPKSGANEEVDWIFDYVLQFLESDKFDGAVMNFVDEKCLAFDDGEENKLIYTDIHAEFREHIEALITSNLGELGITMEVFYESCENGRNGRDVNRTVFEKIIAMDDFETFKKIMVKRNVELQLEALNSYHYAELREDDDDELEAAINASLAVHKSSPSFSTSPGPRKVAAGDTEGDEMQTLLRQSLAEMEFQHRQAELEQAELEQAVAISLALEEERLRIMAEGMKTLSEEMSAKIDEASDKRESSYSSTSADSFEEPKQSVSTWADEKSDGRDIVGRRKGAEGDTTASSKSDRESVREFETVSESEPGRALLMTPESVRARPTKRIIQQPTLLQAEAKPLSKINLKPLVSSKALPPIGSHPFPSSSLATLDDMAAELENKKREAEEALRRGKEQLLSQRQQEQALRQQIDVASPGEAELRAKHMREQRDRLIAMKKTEREKKTQVEEARREEEDAADPMKDSFIRAQIAKQLQQEGKASGGGTGGSKESQGNGRLSAEEVEARRSTMRAVLARRMKLELIESEETRLAQLQESQFAELDQKLRQVEDLRAENKKRENFLAEQLRRQQANIARNVQRSAVSLRQNPDS